MSATSVPVELDPTKLCKVCREPIKTAASKCFYCGSYQDWRVCKICGEPISTTARKCTHCDSYQDWRGGINISNTVLSLLVALVSVLAVAIPAIHEALKAKNSELRFAFQGVNKEAITIFATNSGTRPGAVQSTLTLKVSAAGKTVEVPLTIQLRESSAAT